MKFLLINPPNKKIKSDIDKAVLPLGLAYLAAVLLKDNHDVKIIDAVIEDIKNQFEFKKHAYYGLHPDRIKDEIRAYNPDVVGVSCLFVAVSDISMEICRIAKECSVQYTLIGGPTPSALPELFISKSFIDFVFIGESEKSIADFANSVASNNKPDFSSIDGLTYKDSLNNVVSQPKRSFIENLDDIPLPARHLLPMEKYFQVSSPQGGVFKSRRNIPIMTSRGCPANCYFCASTNIWGKIYRHRSAQNVIDELEHLKREYRIEEFQTVDDNFTLNKQRTLEICNKLKSLGLVWSMPNGVALWALDEERIKAMSEAGCHYVIAAIESGNQRVLKEVIRKPLNLAKGLELCNCIRRHNINLSGFFIVGFPDETLEEIKDTFDYALKCNLDIANFSYATPLPSTDLWKQAEEENLFVDGFDLATLTYGRPSLKSENWEIDELKACVMSFRRKYYIKTFLRHPKILLFRIMDSLKRDPISLIRIIRYALFGK